MTTTKPQTLDQLAKAEAAAQAALQKAQAAADAARAEAEAIRERADAARKAAARAYHLEVRATNKDTRPGLLAAVSEAKQAFADAVIKGEPFGPAYLEVVKRQADLYAHELRYAEALTYLGQSPLRWPEPRPVNLTAALEEALTNEAHRLNAEAREKMEAERRRWISTQAATIEQEQEQQEEGSAA